VKAESSGNLGEPVWASGLDTASSLLIDGAVTGVISFERLVAANAEGPARACGLAKRKGSLAVGRDADFLLIDPELCADPR
jgi:dihydroorotase-like cyclic amidohydrolase